jgi:hypothetical protein
MPPEANLTTSRAPPNKQLSFTQKQSLFEDFSKKSPPLVDRGRSPPHAQIAPERRFSLVTGKPKVAVETKNVAPTEDEKPKPSDEKPKPVEKTKALTPKNSAVTKAVKNVAVPTPAPDERPAVMIHVAPTHPTQDPLPTAAPILEDAKSSVVIPCIEPPFELFGVKNSTENVKVECFQFKVVPIHEQREQLCEFWISNRGEEDVHVDIPAMPDWVEELSVFSLVDAKNIGRISPGTVKMSTSNKFVVKCKTAKLKKNAENVIIIPWKNKVHPETQYYRFRLYAYALTAAENLQYRSFPLRYIPDKWHLVANDVVNPEFKDNVEKTLGLHVSLAFLAHLYGLDHIPGWSDVKDIVEVGLIKDTNDCGNSSVSMGLAWNYFKARPQEEYVAFLNCGTGGVKLQFYTREHDPSGKKILVSIAYEYKPEEMGAVANITGVGNYRPQGKKQPLEDVKKELIEVVLERFANYKRIIREKTSEEKREINWTQKKPYAFVTGTIRSHWEKANDDMKQEMELKMIELFSSEDERQNLAVPVSDLLCEDSGKKNRRCYFVSTDDEGRMEFIGVRAMQKSVDRVINTDASARVDPVAVLGVGTGASRLTILSSKTVGRLKKKEYVVIPHEAGMTKTVELLKLGRVLVGDERIAKFVEACLLADSRGRIPMIALKSGALLRLWDESSGLKARKALTTSPDVEYFKTKGHDGKSRQMILNATTLSRFAVDASKLAKSESDYLVARKDGVRLGPGVFGHVSVEFVKTAPPEAERKGDTCYIAPKDSIVWEGLPAFVWWWPWQNREDYLNNDGCKAPLLIRLPFALLKDFLPFKKPESIVKRFERMLQDFLGHEASKSAKSYECICKVYRLLLEVRHYDDNSLEKATKDKYDADAEKMVNCAILFASRAPKYDRSTQSQFKLSRGYVTDKLANCKKDELTGWRALNKEKPTEWKLPGNTFRQDAKSFSENRRKAWFLLDPFTRALQAACDSKLLSAFSGLSVVAGVKSEKGLLRKQEDDRKEPEDIYDYLRGTIYVGRGKESMMIQVLAILDAIQAHVASFERIKWDHCDKDKGFIIVNVRFSVGCVSILSEVQIRLPSKKILECPPR